MRVRSGDEVLIARVLSAAGKVGLGFSFRLDATEARRMAMRNAGIELPLPAYAPVLDHPWEHAWVSGARIDWSIEPGFAALRWVQITAWLRRRPFATPLWRRRL